MKGDKMYYKQLANIVKAIMLTFIIAISLVGCSSDPSSTAKKIFENKILSQSQGKLKLISFTKKNGVEREMFGQRLYEFEYEAIIEFNQSGWMFPQNMVRPYEVKDHEPTEWYPQVYKYYEKGSQLTFSGTLNLEKTENGWRGN